MSYGIKFRDEREMGKWKWIDANNAEEFGGSIGRLINHSYLAPNCEVKVRFTIIYKMFLIQNLAG